MPIQSLGIFDSVFDWVCDKLFSPIIDWLSKILNSIFEWILNTIVMPLLKPVFDFLWNIVIANIADLFYTFIYNGYCQFLWLLDQLQNGFDVLIGLKDVTYTTNTGEKTQTTLLQYFMNNEIIRNALISITFIALALSVIFAIYSVMRSTLDFDFEGKRPVGRVLSSVAKTMIAFLLVPVIAVFGVSLASIVLKQTCTAISGGDASLGKWVLAISSINAGRGNPPASFTDPSTGLIAEPWASLVEGGTDYLTFGVQIHISQIDYLLGYASIIFMAIVMIMCLFTFIKRIFDIIILYITSPYFVSTIVLDDGEKFKRWRENFIARVLVGFGSVIGMRIFLMMVPVIMNDQLKIFDSVAGNITGGYVIRLVFILGGMFAVYKSSTLLTGIINANVAAEENMNNALVGGMLMAGAKKGGKALWGKGKDAFSGLMSKSKSGAGAGGGTKAGSSSNKFTGGSESGPGKISLPKNADSAAKKSAEAANKAPEKDDILGLSGDSLKDDYIGQGVLDAEKAATEDVDPLGKIDGLDNFDFDADYLSKDLDGDFSGNADISGIKSFDGEAEAQDIPDKFEMADDAIRQNGEQTLFFGDDTVTKSDDYDIGNLFNEDYTDEKPLYEGDLTDILDNDYSQPDTEGAAHFTGNISDLGSQISDDNYSVPDISDSGHFTDNITDLGSLISDDNYSVADISDSGHFADNISSLDSVLHSDNYQPEADRQARQDREEIAAREAARAQRMAQRRNSAGTNSTFTSTGNDPLKNPESSFTANIPAASGSARPSDTKFTPTGNDPLGKPESSRNANISAASGSARPADTEFSSAANDPLKNPPKNDNNSKK